MEQNEAVVDDEELSQLAFMIVAFNALVARFGGQVQITPEEVYTQGRRRLKWERDGDDHSFSLGPPDDEDDGI